MTNRFDTKIAIAVRADLQAWQKLNVTAFLSSGIAASAPETMGKPYEDGSGNTYLELFRQPVVVYAADGPTLRAAHQRALTRGMPMAIYTMDMFTMTTGLSYAPSPSTAWSSPAWPCTARATPWTRYLKALICTHESSSVPDQRSGR